MEKNLLADYHINISNSADSKVFMDSICQEAMKKGIKEICIIENMDFQPESLAGFDYDKICHMTDYANKTYAGIICRKGIKTEYEALNLPLIFDLCLSYDFDFILGSVNKIRGIDTDSDEFAVGRNEEDIFTEYINTVREMICINMFNSVPYMYFAGKNLGVKNSEKYKELICDTLKEIIKRDMSLEIEGNDLLNDNQKILTWYKDLGGKNLIYGSGSYKAEEIGKNINEIYNFVRNLGFENMTIYENRIKKYISL